MRILIVYPNIPLMMSPPISVALFTAICKKLSCQIDLFETTGYIKSSDGGTRVSRKKAGHTRAEPNPDEWISIYPPEQMIPDFIKKVEDFKPHLILMSVVEDSFSVGLDLLNSIKDKKIPNIVGGVFATFAAKEILKYDVVDQICHQEGEQVIEDAILKLRKNESLDDIKGTTYRHKDHSHRNAPAQLVDINKIRPDFSLFEKKRFGRNQGGKWFNFSLPMETYRGCPYQCTYCNSPGQRAFSKSEGTGNFMRRKSAETIQEEFEYYKELYDVDHVNFVDDSFLARPVKELEEFTKIWSKHKTPFWANTRIENCTKYIMDLMKEAGMYRITFGLESGNEEYRKKYLKRNISNEKYLEHIQIINESNIPYSLNSIIGMPYETKEMALDTARFCREVKGHDSFIVSAWQPYHGTELRNIAVRAGFIDEDLTWSLEQKLKMGNDGLMYTVVEMPEPYLRPWEVKDLVKKFPLYSYFPDELYPEIEKEENYDTLVQMFRDDYYAKNIQEGGKQKITRMNKENRLSKSLNIFKSFGTCMQHDGSVEDIFVVGA